MPKQPTEKQIAARKAFGEAAKARAAAKRADEALANETPIEQLPEPRDPNAHREPGSHNELGMDDLRAMVMELQAAQIRNQGAAPSYTQTGASIGSREKYNTDPNYYPDPREKLALEPRLAPFAFSLNYELDWNVSLSEYTTMDNVRTKEPKFTLKLVRIIRDEFSGEATNGRYDVCQLILHEDEDAAIVVARENGLEVDEDNPREFLDDMRYLRMRNWLIEAFYPPPPTETNKKREMVIDGKIVQYFEVNSENSAAIDFKQLNTKV